MLYKPMTLKMKLLNVYIYTLNFDEMLKNISPEFNIFRCFTLLP